MTLEFKEEVWAEDKNMKSAIIYLKLGSRKRQGMNKDDKDIMN